MKQRFYLDTAIWRDYFEDRKDRFQPLGEFAFQFLKNCESHSCEVLYSSLVVNELKAEYTSDEIQGILAPFRKYLVEVQIVPEQLKEAQGVNSRLKDTHLADILHAILARDNGAIMITRDKHFEALASIVEVLKPEEVTFG